MHSSRYIFDVLYGHVLFPDYVWKVALTPEVQRLREVRLCNINSLCLTGGANINRYEHVVGTAALMQECLDSWTDQPHPMLQRRLVLAALMHDIGSAAFGHSVQYVLDPHGYRHESIYDIVIGTHANGEGDGTYRYQDTEVEQIYFGMPRRLLSVLRKEELEAISNIVRGGGPYGVLLNGTIDLDNIDNVFRLAFHIGLTRDSSTARALGRSLRVSSGKLLIESSAAPLLVEWYKVRRHLYRYLLLNPDEFAAKCMLQEAVELAQRQSSFRWYDIDAQLLLNLSRSSTETADIVARLMVGDLYGCAGLFATSRIEIYELLNNPDQRRTIEEELKSALRQLKLGVLKNVMVALHPIKDVNKTDRRIEATTTGGQELIIGEPSHRVLIGVFFRNVHLSMAALDPATLKREEVESCIQSTLSRLLGDATLTSLEPYGEAKIA